MAAAFLFIYEIKTHLYSLSRNRCWRWLRRSLHIT